MKLIASFKNKKSARAFSRILQAQGLSNQINAWPDEYQVWLHKDNELSEAKRLYQLFTQNPNQPELKTKLNIKSEGNNHKKTRRQTRKHFKRQHSHSITIVLIITCIAVFGLSYIGSQDNIMGYFLILPYQGGNVWHVWLSQPWRLITPIFLHFGILHILFNLYWLYSLGKAIETRESRLFYPIFIITCAIASNLSQFFVSGPYFGGMSGVVYALFAYIWISAKYNPWSGYYIADHVAIVMLFWFILCFTGFIGAIANYGHLGGLIAGGCWALGKKWIKSYR